MNKARSKPVQNLLTNQSNFRVILQKITINFGYQISSLDMGKLKELMRMNIRLIRGLVEV
eukprot:snap_masked-scaffold_66-processed-gene-0.51-mRNA-1 protein AED:1.00 eAED:1.00 QI:0/0/0/0/1/1/2/0/59